MDQFSFPHTAPHPRLFYCFEVRWRKGASYLGSPGAARPTPAGGEAISSKLVLRAQTLPGWYCWNLFVPYSTPVGNDYRVDT